MIAKKFYVKITLIKNLTTQLHRFKYYKLFTSLKHLSHDKI